MIINENVLLDYGAVYDDFFAGHTIFNEGGIPKYYYQIVKGTVELNNYHEDGKEFTQNIIEEGHCIGESLLFNDKPYPMNAVARTECTVLKLPKEDFFLMLHQNHEICLKMFKCLADRLFYKYLMLFNLSSADPSFKLQTLMNYLKGDDADKYTFEIPLTRRQIANLTGLRTETVIRTVKKMEKQKLLKIENRKIYY